MSILYNDKSGAAPQAILLAGNANTDQILNGTSKNAIANKAVYNALQDKIDKAVQDLVYYYTKSDVYNKAETRALLSTISSLDIKVVNSLPVSDISTTTIYFLKPTGSQNYDEYVYVDNAWVKIGDTGVDLSQYLEIDDFNVAIADYYTKAEIDAKVAGYYTKAEVDTLLNEINTEVDGKQDKLTFDNVPTAGSNNPVKSNGIKSAIDDATTDIYEVMGKNGAKNLLFIDDSVFRYREALPPIMLPTGVEISNSTAGTFRYCSWWLKNLKENTDYVIVSKITIVSGTSGIIIRDSDTGTSIVDKRNISGNVKYSFNTGNYTSLYITLYSAMATSEVGDVKYENLMIRLASDTDDTYQLYAETNYQLTKDKISYTDNGILGAKNLLGLSKIATSESNNGVTLIKNSNGSFTLNGTATADTFFKLLTDFPTSGKYIFSGMDTGSYNNTYWIWLGNISNGNLAYYQGKAIYSDTRESIPFDITQLKTYSSTAITIDNLCIWITVKNGTTLSNKTIYPMLRLASDPDSTYQPYAMTNRELTNQKIDLYGLTSSTSVWQGDTLTFKIIPNNAIMYHLIAMEAARQDTDVGAFCEAYIIMRSMGETAPNIRNRGVNNIVGTWDSSSSSLIITLPKTSYWMYRFSIEALHPSARI